MTISQSTTSNETTSKVEEEDVKCEILPNIELED
jgi:hypothetical protein